MDWSSSKLGDLLEKVIDNRGKTPPLADEGLELIETTSLTGGGKFPDYSLVRKHVSQETFDTWFRAGHPRKGDILVATVGANIGSAVMMMEARGCVAQNLVGLRANTQKADPDFLYYYLTCNRTRDELKRMDIGSAQPSLKVPHLLNVEIHFPPLPVQRRIAGILSAYDELIENSQRRIRLLEDMARALYREWFVHFRFPGHESAPRHPSALGEIPQGWEVKAAPECIDFNPRVTVPREGEKPFLPMGCLSTDSMIISDIESRTSNSGSKFQNGDTLFARITPCLENGKTGFVQFLPDASAVAFGSTEFIVMRSQTLTPEFVYCLARSDEFRGNAIKSMSGATGRQRVQEKCFDGYLIAQPPKELLKRFAAIVQPSFQLIHQLHLRIENLRRTRDLLLPRLLSGQVEIEETKNH